MGLATMAMWMVAAAELMEGFADLAEIATRMGAGEGVSDERLARVRQQNKESIARLRAAIKANQESQT